MAVLSIQQNTQNYTQLYTNNPKSVMRRYRCPLNYFRIIQIHEKVELYDFLDILSLQSHHNVYGKSDLICCVDCLIQEYTENIKAKYVA